LKLYELTARDLTAKINSGEVSSREAVESVLTRIDAMEESINAYISVTCDEALAMADDIDQRRAKGETLGTLAGVPMAIKDSIVTEGIKTTAGSHILNNFIPPYDATVIEKLKSAGAVIIGKSNTDEFTMGSTCETSYFGP